MANKVIVPRDLIAEIKQIMITAWKNVAKRLIANNFLLIGISVV